MSRNLYCDVACQPAFHSSGFGTTMTSLAGTSVTVYLDSGLTSPANISNNSTGTSIIVGSIIVLDSNSKFPDFWGPDPDPLVLYCSVLGGPTTPIVPKQYLLMASILTRLTAVEAATTQSAINADFAHYIFPSGTS